MTPTAASTRASGSSSRVSPADEFIDAVQQLGTPDRIPRFERLSERLHQGHRLGGGRRAGADPRGGLLRAAGDARFPVTDWIRKPEEFDYVVEPDVFHDLFGHVPLLFNPVFADYMQAYGAGGLKASRLDACELLARLYWYTVEFGLIDTPEGLRAYGAGILSSAGELRYSVTSPEPQRIAFDLQRMMRTPLQDRYLPGQLLRDRLLPAAVRGDGARLHADLREAARAARGRCGRGAAG